MEFQPAAIPTLPCIRGLKQELIIMYTWDVNGYYDNRVCGHMYEVIEYFWALKDNFNAKIIFPQEYDLDKVVSKYNFNEDEIQEIRNACIPRPKSGIIRTRKGEGLILIVDGNLGNFKGFLYGIPVQFSCGKLGLVPKDPSQKWYLLHDERICSKEEFDYFNLNPASKTFDYTKRILFDRIPVQIPQNESGNPVPLTGLLYLTSNCKYLSPKEITNTIIKHSNIKNFYIIKDYDIKFNTEIRPFLDPKINIEVIDILGNPINIFKLDFTHYIYTNVKREWDCSNRLIAECSHNKRGIILDVDYEDNALKTRMNDSYPHKLYQSLNLDIRDTDKITYILERIHNEYIEAKNS